MLLIKIYLKTYTSTCTYIHTYTISNITSSKPILPASNHKTDGSIFTLTGYLFFLYLHCSAYT